MERRRCPHCGHSTPPPSPSTGAEDPRRSPPIQQWDLLDASRDSLPVPSDSTPAEPHLASELYRPLWDFFGLTILSITSVILYFFLSPGSFPWFLVVTAFFVFVWIGYHIIRNAGSDELSAQQKCDQLFELHMRLWIATCMFCSFIWLFMKPWAGPWFTFVVSGAGLFMTVHHATVYIDWKRQWLFPQMQLYLNTTFTCYIINTFYTTFSGAWWLWPTCVWGILILIQFMIFVMITKRRIRLGEIDPEAARGVFLKKPRTSLRRVPSEVPLLVDFSHEVDAPISVTPKHALTIQKEVRTRLAPPAIQHRALHPSDIRQRPIPPRVSAEAPLMWAPPQEPKPEMFDADDSVSLVECVSSPPARLSAKLKLPNPATRPISMRVVHHDDHTAEVVNDSLTGSEGVYIDVVHIPTSGATGFG